MAKTLRYALATVCFATSVGSLALWWRGQTRWDMLVVPSALLLDRHTTVVSSYGRLEVTVHSKELTTQHGLNRPGWRHEQTTDVELRQELYESGAYTAWFGKRRHSVYFPLWYPALVFAIAGVGVLRFRRQFSIRSTLVGLTVFALLLGMVAAL